MTEKHKGMSFTQREQTDGYSITLLLNGNMHSGLVVDFEC